jgi:Dockerin type I domain
VDATDVLTPGDYNQDGFVNSADYGAWRSEFSQDVFHHGTLIADGNADGFVDAADYVVWRANISAGGAAGVSAAAVPEPVSLMLSIVAGANFSWFYLRPRRPSP